MKLPPYRLFQIILLGLIVWLWFKPPPDLYTTDSIAAWNDQEESVTLMGVIVEYPDIRRDTAKYVVSELTSATGEKIKGRLLINSFVVPEYQAYDVIELYGRPETPFETEEFSYKNYLLLDGITSVMKRPYIKKVGEVSHWQRSLFQVKNWFETTLNQRFPEPQASLAAGLVTGSRRGIPADLLEDFNTTGLTHIIAISGYNISLVIVFISWLFKPFPTWLRTILSIGAIIVFVIFVGGQAAVVRAGIMGIIHVLILRAHRPSNITNVLLVTALLMAWSNPFLLDFDIGFKLSFASTLGLIYFSPILSRLFERLPDALAIKESVILTVSAQVFTAPLIIYYFNRFSLVSVLCNLLVAPLIPLAMLLSTLTAIFSIFGGLITTLLSFFAYYTLGLIIAIATVFARVPLASIDLSLTPTTVLIYYAAITLLVILLRRTKYFTEFPLFASLG